MDRAKPPKPPRVVSVEPEAVEVSEDDAESLLKKLRRDQLPPEPPWPLPDEVRDAQALERDGSSLNRLRIPKSGRF
jgi:hypothetical protein